MTKLSKTSINKTLIAGIFLCLALTFAHVDGAAWSRRTGWDIVSYLDVGDAILRGDWHAALNSYWSPLYGFIFAIVNKIFANFSSELVRLEFFNLSIFFLLALAFGYLTDTLRKTLEKVEDDSNFLLSDNLLPVVLYTTFIYCALAICGIRYKTPDVMSALICMLFFCLWLPAILKPISTGRALLLGFLLGLSYLAKSVLINWAGLVILCLLINRKLYKITNKQLVCLVAAAGVTVAAWALPVSINVGHATLNDVMTVGQAWMSTLQPDLVQVHGRGPTFKHPTREFFKNPDFYEFVTPFDVSYSPWYAPAYWFEGVPWKGSMSHYRTTLVAKIPKLMASYLGVLLVGFGLLWLVTRSPFSSKRLRICLPMILPGAAALFAFAVLFEPEGRYFIAFTLPLFASLFTCLKSADRESKIFWQILTVKGITAYMMLVCLSIFLMQFYFFSPGFANYLKSATKVELPPSPPYSAHEGTVSVLKGLGVVEGDRVARISTLGHGEFYWARGGKFKVVAECVNPAQFAQATAERRDLVYQKLRQLGVKAIVEDWSQDQEEYPLCKDSGWIQVPGTRNWVYRL
ncbi:hypothetical protein BH10CYA1_BH10CYA1_19860 [soil metagenome]